MHEESTFKMSIWFGWCWLVGGTSWYQAVFDLRVKTKKASSLSAKTENDKTSGQMASYEND